VNPSNPSRPINPTILLTFDVEYWFQVENFNKLIPYSSWSSYELRVERNTLRLLDIIDQTRSSPPASKPHILTDRSNPKATFFILAWIAERLPSLVREIHDRGHEVASHGYGHKLCNSCSLEEVKEDLINSKRLLEDLIGDRIHGYRAPCFSINDYILKIVEDCGYLYDSSYNSFEMHGRYGHLSIDNNGNRGIGERISDGFYELPISNIRLGHQILPWGGGGYFRLLSFPIFKLWVKSILKRQGAYLFYLHPWEIDPEQPRVSEAPLFFRFRHYVNLKGSQSKLTRLIEHFAHCRFITCINYLTT